MDSVVLDFYNVPWIRPKNGFQGYKNKRDLCDFVGDMEIKKNIRGTIGIL